MVLDFAESGLLFSLSDNKDNKVAKIDRIHSYDNACCGLACIPLNSRLHIVSVVEEEHEVVQVDEAKLVEYLEEIVYIRLLWHRVDQVDKAR